MESDKNQDELRDALTNECQAALACLQATIQANNFSRAAGIVSGCHLSAADAVLDVIGRLKREPTEADAEFCNTLGQACVAFLRIRLEKHYGITLG